MNRGFVIWVSEDAPDCPKENCPTWTEAGYRDVPMGAPNGLRTFCNRCRTMVVTQP